MRRESRTPTILVVDDHASVRGAIVSVLLLTGYAVREAENGAEGVRVALQERPDLVLVDVDMPVLDGIGAVESLRRDPVTRQTPIVLISAGDEIVTRARTAEAGADAFLPKPFLSVHLLTAIAGFLPLPKGPHDRILYVPAE